MKKQLLLVEDVHGLGRKGELVSARSGYIRNFLLPKGKAVIASKQTLRMRERLQKEREAQAAIDKEESEKMAGMINGKVFKTEVKIDPSGHLYGSVGVSDIIRIFDEEGMTLERHHVRLGKPIRKIGTYTIDLVLNEGVPASFDLQVMGEGGVLEIKQPKKEEKKAEESPEDENAEGTEEKAEGETEGDSEA